MQAICTNALKLKPLHIRCCAYIRFCVYLLVCIDKNDGWGKQYNSHSGVHNRWAGKSWPHTALIRDMLFTQCGVVAVFRCAFVSDAKSWIAQNSTYTNYISSTLSRNTAAGDSVCPFHSLSPTRLKKQNPNHTHSHSHSHAHGLLDNPFRIRPQIELRIFIYTSAGALQRPQFARIACRDLKNNHAHTHSSKHTIDKYFYIHAQTSKIFT